MKPFLLSLFLLAFSSSYSQTAGEITRGTIRVKKPGIPVGIFAVLKFSCEKPMVMSGGIVDFERYRGREVGIITESFVVEEPVPLTQNGEEILVFNFFNSYLDFSYQRSDSIPERYEVVFNIRVDSFGKPTYEMIGSLIPAGLDADEVMLLRLECSKVLERIRNWKPASKIPSQRVPFPVSCSGTLRLEIIALRENTRAAWFEQQRR